MKIGIVCYPTFGGSGVVATELGIALAKKGHEVHFITYDRPIRLGAFEKNTFFHEVKIADYPLFEFVPYESALSSMLVDVVKFKNLDLLHVHYAIPHASSAFLAQQILKSSGIHIPFITTLHGTDITLVGNDHSYQPVVEFSINESNGVTSVSESLKNETLSFFNISDKNKIRVIPNFIDLNRFKKIEAEHYKSFIAPNDEKILVHVSNFRELKRVNDVLDVFCLIHKKTPMKLLLVGDGPERQKMEEKCREKGICEQVMFLGKQTAVEEILSISDVFLLTSSHESFGLAALEAMACGVPVVASNAGGIPEVVINGENGFTHNVGDVVSMSKSVLKILHSSPLRSKLSQNALKTAQKFSLEKIVPLYEKYYMEVLKN